MSWQKAPRACLLTPVLLAAVACGEAPTSTLASAGSEPAFQTTQRPEGAGAFVVRFEDIMGFLFAFEDPALTVLTGLTLDQLDEACTEGGEPVFDPAAGKLVFLPDGSSHGVLKASDFTVLVFEGFFADFCSGVQPIAIGQGDFTQTEGGPFGARIAYVHHTLRARVSEQSGEQHHLLIRSFFQFDRRTGETRQLSQEITLN